jgi:hypothetical protein
VPTSARSRSLINRAYRHKADGVDDALGDLEDQDIVGVASPDRGVRGPARRGQQGADHQAWSTCCCSRRSSCAPRTSTCSPIQDRRAGAHARRRRAVRHRGDPEAGAGGDHLSRVKVMGKMDIAERRLPQDGRASHPHRRRRRRRAHLDDPGEERRAHRLPYPRQDGQGLPASTRSASSPSRTTRRSSTATSATRTG